MTQPAELNPELTAVRDALLAARASGVATAASAAAVAALAHEDAAFAVQFATGVALGEWQPGDVPVCWKSGGPGRDKPLVHAPLLPSGVHQLASDGVPADLRATRFLSPMIEGEVALRLGREVTPEMARTLDETSAVSLIEAMALSIEVVDARWANLREVPGLLKLADFQVHGALVLGPWQPWQDRDWAAQRGEVQFGSEAPRPFQGTHSLGTPQWLLPIWLRHVTRHGQTVPAGAIVTTGTWSGCLPVARGQRIVSRFEGLGELALDL